MTAPKARIPETAWTRTSIFDHPLWALEVELERKMGTLGAEVIQGATAKAKRRGQLTRLKPVRHLLHDWLVPVADHLREWIRACTKTRGPTSIGILKLAEMDPRVAALAGLRAVLDGVTSNNVTVASLASRVGRFLEHEQQVRLWEEQRPELFHVVRREMDRERATDAHRARVNINRFNHFMREGVFDLSRQPWSDAVRFRVGAEVLGAIMRVTGWFELGEAPDQHFHANRAPQATLLAKPELLAWLAGALDRQEANHVAFMPTVVTPRRWTSMREGGYWTPYVAQPTLIRFHVHQPEQREKAFDDYDSMEMPQVYDALHFLQEVPWRVNHRVYEVAQACIAKDLGVAGLPRFSPRELPPKPWAGLKQADQAAWMAAHPEEVKQWKKAAKPVYSANAQALAERRLPSRTMRVALQYLDHTFYFPHMMDFRGRMYPIPVGLQPQGDDLARGLLVFAEGKPITADNGGDYWLAVHLASCMGNDKVSYADRRAYTLAHEQDWRNVARDPLGFTNIWAAADKPFQALAAIFDWVGFLDEGEGYVSQIPVSVDGTCNGIQHLSAMTRDAVAGEHVNLTPSESPRDIYKFVADRLQDEIAYVERTSAGDAALRARYWLETLGREPGTWSRKLTKRQVMVVPYGGTMEAFFEYTRDWINETIPAQPATLLGAEVTWQTRGADIPEAYAKARNANLTFLAKTMNQVVGEVVAGGTEIMEWLKKCAKAASVGNQPIYWPVATGFRVRHFYGKMESKQVELKLDGHRVQLRTLSPTDKLDVASQLKGIAPNFTHSQDAAALVLSINAVRRDGVKAFAAVHDGYGTHAADMGKLARRLRESFVELHSKDCLAAFRTECAKIVADRIAYEEGLDDPETARQRADAIVPPLPPKGRLDLKEVLASPYFFS